MRGKRKRTVGLSIGARNIAFAEININAEDRVEVGRVGIADTPDDAVINGRILSPSAVSRAVRELFAASQMDGTKEVSLAIADEGSITGLQVLPSMSRSETMEALMGEVENYAVLAGGEPILDFQPTDETVEGTGQQMEVLYLAAPRELVDSYLPAMEAANLELWAMETKSLAVLRAFINSMEQNEGDSPTDNKPVMLVTIEENVGMIIVIRNNVIQFLHNIEIGSKDLENDRDFRALARELSSSVNYYHNTFPEAGEVEDIALFADEPDMADIGERVGAFLDLPITTPQTPGAGESAEGEIAGHNLSGYAAVGAAIRMATRDEEAVNLLPSARRAGAVSLRKRVTLFLLMVFFLGFLSAGARVYIGREADAVELELIELREMQEFSEAEAAADVAVLQAGIATLKAQTEITDAAMNSIKWANCARVLEETRAIIPKTVWLTSLRWSGSNSVSFAGYAMSNDDVYKAYDEAYKFRRTLINSPNFQSVKVRYIRSVDMSGREIVQFEFQCGVKREKLGEGGAS
ncbi:pilus assembly protein PilM [Candidatus Poribacteria bacterium]